MSASTHLTIAVASDLHAFGIAEAGKAPSYLQSGLPEDSAGTHPVKALLTLLERDDVTADLLLSPGDLADKADPIGIQLGWQTLNRLKEQLRAKELVATAGNHDVDSRFLHDDHDALVALRALTPRYPLADPALCNEYWSNHFTIIETSDYRLLLLNSSAFHGNTPNEKNHGRLDLHTLIAIESRLSEKPPKTINILLCHHHPQQHSEIKLGDYDWMREGQALLDLLGSGTHGSWIVIHGHKHHPKLSYAAGGCGSPVVFAAASFSAHLYPELYSRTRNQFHVVTVQPMPEKGGILGNIRSWEFAYGRGWLPPGLNSGLPHVAGFGFRGDLKAVSKQIADQVVPPYSTWNTVRAAVPELDYVLPQDYQIIKQYLRNDHNLKLYEENGEVSLICRA